MLVVLSTKVLFRVLFNRGAITLLSRLIRIPLDEPFKG